MRGARSSSPHVEDATKQGELRCVRGARLSSAYVEGATKRGELQH